MTNKVGQRQTRQRKMIYEIISSASGPITIEEIYQLTKRQSSPIGIATIYRTINLFLQNNKIIKTTLADGQPRYESASKGKYHHHLLCRVYDKAICVDTPIEYTNTQINADFIVESHELIVHGVCNPCTSADQS